MAVSAPLGEAHAEREAREKAAAAARTEAAQLIEEAEGMERRLRDATEVAERLQTGENIWWRPKPLCARRSISGRV